MIGGRGQKYDPLPTDVPGGTVSIEHSKKIKMQQHIQNFKSQFSLPRAIAIGLGLLLITVIIINTWGSSEPVDTKKCPIPKKWKAIPTEHKIGKFTIKKDDCESKKLRGSSKKYEYKCKADGTITPTINPCSPSPKASKASKASKCTIPKNWNTVPTEQNIGKFTIKKDDCKSKKLRDSSKMYTYTCKADGTINPNTNPCSPSPLKKQDKSCTIKWPNTKSEIHPHNKTFIPTCNSPGKKKNRYEGIKYKCTNGIITKADTDQKDDTDPCDRTCGKLPDSGYREFKKDPLNSTELNDDSVIPTDKKRNTYCFVKEGFENYVPQPVMNIYDWMGGRPDINNNSSISLLPGYN